MKYKYLKSIAMMSLAASSITMAQQNESGEDWNTPQAVTSSVWDVELSNEELKAQEDMKAASTAYWVFTAASGATPYKSGYTYNYGGSGCMNASGNAGVAYLDQNINIPDGHTITFMRFYYNDSNAAMTTEADLFIMDGAGGFTTIANRESNTDSGFATVGSPMNHIVDNTNGSLILRYSLKNSSSVSPCGVRFVVYSN